CRMSQMSTGLSRQERPSLSVTPLAVPPREASRLLSVGMSRLYQLMRTGELESYMRKGAWRLDLNGEPAGTVTADEEAHAQATLVRIRPNKRPEQPRSRLRRQPPSDYPSVT